MKREDVLFEISWEVCNKVGGIYTVITSKFKNLLKYVDVKNYFTIGPYYESSLEDFQEKKTPIEFKDKFDELEKNGIKVHYGIWKNQSEPIQALLIEYLGYSKHINEIKEKLWELYNIDSLNSSWYDFDEAILWSWCCGIVIDKLSSVVKKNDNDIYVHSHEWMSGGAIFYLKSLDYNNYKDMFKTVFTTHATMLGRSISGSGEDAYKVVEDENFDANKKAYDIGVETKHQCEKALSITADAFTTVSDITGKEASAFYGKSPDVLLYNGFDNLDIEFLSNLDSVYKHSRDKIITFLEEHFFKYYKFDINDSKLFFTSGRNEFRSKGLDLYIKSLGLLNSKLKDENYNNENSKRKNVINLFLIPIGEFERAPDLSHIRNNSSKLWDFAPLSTHKIPMNNNIIKALIDNGLLNNKNDNVKVLLIPIYLKPNDGVLNMNYYDANCGFDLGIFPSYYEPWGYTPLESIAFGVPTVTTNYSGFGRAILKDFNDKHTGVEIINRDSINFDNSCEELSKYLFHFLNKSSDEIKKEKKDTQEFAKKFSWGVFIENYMKAYDIAKNNCE